ncbi:MAG: VWA domain-containing protein [Oligosphaeraceae bacterium]|nr:VWA domain-containing protein [Oligosphaeraceae bacterium]
MYRFESPIALLGILLPLLLYAWRRMRRQRPPAIPFSGLALLRLDGVRSWRLALQHLPAFLGLAAWVLLCLALARPQSCNEQVQEYSEGIAIEMLIDCSSSMTQEMEYDRRRMNRLQAVKQVFTEFVFGDKAKGLGGRSNDLIGIIRFARYADTLCPLTLDHEALRQYLDSVQIVTERSEDGTNIGDALALAAARLHEVEQTLAEQNRREPGSYEIKSKVIILLTDGENNCGKRSIAEAGELAQKWGVKVYAIVVTAGEGSAGGLFARLRRTPSLDARPLQEITDQTGGVFRWADDADSLLAVYREIDQLERSEMETLRALDVKECFAPFAFSALVLLCLKLLLENTMLRRLP